MFGGGIAESALVPGKATFNLNLNTSDSRELDQIQLRLQDGEEGTIKELVEMLRQRGYTVQTKRFQRKLKELMLALPKPDEDSIKGPPFTRH